ncbi:SDR family NAD(P)-dependent oxidoreductase [Nocardia stercoris]|uniref:SDR family oxidoreductase n=1 Tax=Nocardia stercoris TaxID=2483361 RepID=A0A3M2LBB7_9NOCA|nr:SDR family NAD(P)-dependent oxidoreductase [Nocardia stercoris]RMI34851.1 SDR family oxidoreductase [Nocardia stercoris]
MQQRHDGRRVIVTGAGSGIGQGIVLRMLAEGARVVAADIVEAGLKETVAAAGDHADRLSTVVVDISDETSVAAALTAAREYLGGLDVLVNAAGIMKTARTHEMSLADWNRIIGINLTGTFLMIRESLPTLLESETPVIVNFSSTSAFLSHPYMAAYSATKGGINAMTHSLALEYVKQGLRAVNIVPGGITSGITTQLDVPENADWDLFSRLSGRLNGGALGTPADIAGVVAMVASEDGKYMTGTELRVDGGALM